jgi:hypothetical protein
VALPADAPDTVFEVDVQDMTGVAEGAPAALHLSNYPNPFNPRTTLRFSLVEDGAVDLRIYDISGRQVRILAAGEHFGAGRHEIEWHGTGEKGRALASGLYLCQLLTGESSETIRLVILK